MAAEQSDALVFFGATGDLAHKQIFPALYAMVRRGSLNMPVVGVAKAGWTLDQLKEVTELWRRGSVIASWLLDLTAQALLDDPHLSKFAGRVSDSGEGRWTVKAAIDEAVPAHVLSAALYERFDSRGEAEFGDRVLSAMRFAFGGHLEKPH